MYQTNGNFLYFIEESFAHDDIILPISGKAQRLQEEIQQIDKLRGTKAHAEKLSDLEQDMVNVMITPHKSTDGMKKASTFKIQSSATRVSDGSKDTKSDSDHGAPTSTETMFKRW